MFSFVKRQSVCKDCVIEIYQSYVDKYVDLFVATYNICRLLDVYYNRDLFASAMEQAKNQNTNELQIYFQKVNSLSQYANLTFAESTDTEMQVNVIMGRNKPESTKSVTQSITQNQIIDSDKNKLDVLRMLNYDPFEGENETDKRQLYNLLVDFLDESTLEDSFKLSAVIQIVKGFNQIDKINQGLALITSDINNLSSQVGGIKSLIDAKEKMMRAILGFAKDNGISENYSTNKSKGAGTLSGIIKMLQERGFTEADVNLFDVETAQGLKQVADISNESILKQLQFDENDYTDMITQQRELIQDLDTRLKICEEENRKLKILSPTDSGGKK
jgi:hypothetical protein